jgi:hypothetical protein
VIFLPIDGGAETLYKTPHFWEQAYEAFNLAHGKFVRHPHRPYRRRGVYAVPAPDARHFGLTE